MNTFIGVAIVLVLVVVILYLVDMLPLAPRNKHILLVTTIVIGVLAIMRQLDFL